MCDPGGQRKVRGLETSNNSPTLNAQRDIQDSRPLKQRIIAVKFILKKLLHWVFFFSPQVATQLEKVANWKIWAPHNQRVLKLGACQL